MRDDYDTGFNEIKFNHNKYSESPFWNKQGDFSDAL